MTKPKIGLGTVVVRCAKLGQIHFTTTTPKYAGTGKSIRVIADTTGSALIEKILDHIAAQPPRIKTATAS